MKREELESTEIYASFASEVYDDFGESLSEQGYYRKEHADKVMDAMEARIKELEAEVIDLDEIEKQKQKRSKMTKSKRRYELYKYLDLADIDVSFADFLLSHQWDARKAEWNCL